MYKQIIDPITNSVATNRIFRIQDNTYIPFDPANTDFANFKKEINDNEAQLQDADGKTMTANKAKEFVATLP
jgi:hypothetical protein